VYIIATKNVPKKRRYGQHEQHGTNMVKSTHPDNKSVSFWTWVGGDKVSDANTEFA